MGLGTVVSYATAAMLLAIISFILFGGNVFTTANTIFWILGIVFLFFALWQRTEKQPSTTPGVNKSFYIVFVLATILVVFFRVFQINQIPAEMYSDPTRVMRVNTRSMNSAVFFPGRIPGMNPPCFLRFSATSVGLKVTAV